MAEIKPFKAWRYNREAGKRIETLISPLFDVVTPGRLQELYADPINSIHLSVPVGGASNAAITLREWKENGLLVQDDLPGIYVYYQYYTDPFDGLQKCRKGFVCNIRVHDWEEKVILHHENTIPGSVSDRLAILTETGFHASATHGIYTDPNQNLQQFMDEAISAPLYTNTSDGITEVIGVIHDYEVIQQFIQVLADKQIILADGHHRYEASIQHAKQRRIMGDLTPEYHLMFLSNSENGGLTILPTHRMISGMEGFEETQFLKKLEDDFEIEPISNNEVDFSSIQQPESFIVLVKNSSFKIRLRPERVMTNPWPFPPGILKLDLTILHYFILEKIFHIPGAEQRRSGKISFERDSTFVKESVQKGRIQTGILTRPVSIEAILNVCASGYTLPQKSTWFYPKLNTGYFFSSILPGESRLPDFVKFQ